MVERGEDFGLTLKATETINIQRKLIRKNLDRHIALQLGVSGTIYLSHTAAPKEGCDFERTKVCADTN